MLPVPTNANVLAILDRIMRQIARRLAKDAANGELEEDAAPRCARAGPGRSGEHVAITDEYKREQTRARR